MRVGIIGIGQSGKSSLFYSLTGQPPDPPSGKPRRRIGTAYVPEPRVELVARLDGSKRTSYPQMVVIDPEGFPADVGRSMNSEMLGMTREAELLALVIRVFKDPSIMHPMGHVNAARDLDSCFSDLIIQDLSVLEHRLLRIRKDFDRGKKELKRELEACEKAAEGLEDGKFISALGLNNVETEQLAGLELLTMKHGIVVWNVDEDAEFGRGGRGVPDEIRKTVEDRGWGIGAASLKIETEIMEIEPSEREAFLEDLGLTETIRERFLTAAYKRLGLITFFTGGPVEAAARQIPSGSTAFDAAGKVHADIQRGFIRAEVMSFDDLNAFGSIEAVKKAGKYRLEKKEYIVQDGDIIHFRFNV